MRRGAALALDAVDCRFPAGAVTAVAGGNGSGKSTLLEVLAGLIAPSAGVVSGLPSDRALVVQRMEGEAHVPITAREAVAIGLWRELGLLRRAGAEGRRRIDAALDEVGMLGMSHTQLSAMSGGQRQRVMVAQGIVQDAPLLLLDEPSAAADADARDRIDAALARRAADGAIVVLATHDRTSIARADRVVLLEHGRIVVDGSPDGPEGGRTARAEAALGGQRAGGGPVEERTTSTGA